MEAVGEWTRSVYLSSGLSRNLRRTGAHFAGLTLVMVALSMRLRLSPQARREKARAQPRQVEWSESFGMQHSQNAGRRPWKDDAS